MKKHVIDRILPGSIAEECGFEKGDKLLSINGNQIEDTFDYQYLISDEFLVLEVESKQGEVVELEIEKDAEEDLGLVFENSFMDNYRSCKNKCIFCFIDQMPPGMRETLYFKDDDTRLSFLQGNYVTLTNLSDADVEKIIRYRMEPINISFQTMNPELRCKMLNNRFAGEALKKAKQLYDAGIEMNGQIVLCKGVNDGEELEFSIKEMYKYTPVLRSVSVVPVGLSKYRDGLYPLEPFDQKDAEDVIDRIERWQGLAYKEKGIHFVHASDEWYILAGRDFPEEDRYDGYVQIENGVGMARSMFEDARRVLEQEDRMKEDLADPDRTPENAEKGAFRKATFATGVLAKPLLEHVKSMVLARREADKLPQSRIIAIRNDFFGEHVTVAGLVTGRDLIEQLRTEDLGEILFLPNVMFRSGEEVFLDDLTKTDAEKALGVPIAVLKGSSEALIHALCGRITEEDIDLTHEKYELTNR